MQDETKPDHAADDEVAAPPASLPTVKLSAAQQRVMKWLGKGWKSEPGAGSAVLVNGARLCNVDTMSTLERHGLVRCIEHGCWESTPLGRQLTAARGW